MKASVIGVGLLAAAAVGACGGHDDGPRDVCADGSCADGRCSVSVPNNAFGGPGRVRVHEIPVPAALVDDSVAPFMCSVSIEGGPLDAPVRLTAMTGLPSTTSILFRHAPPHDVGLSSSIASHMRVEALIEQSGDYGVTKAPPGWKVDTIANNDPLASADPPSWLRNLSSQPIRAAYYDGKSLFVASGSRVLVWDGIPKSPAERPRMILGQPDLDTIVPGTTASIMRFVQGIWSDQTKLVVSNGNRVLVWSTMPTQSFTPADVVLGQQDFVSNGINSGGISASTLWQPAGIDSDGNRLLVTDVGNNRVLVWDSFPKRIAEPASSAIGQPTFASGDYGIFFQPWTAKLDGTGAWAASYFTGAFHFPDLHMNVQPDFSPVDPRNGGSVTALTLGSACGIAQTPSGGLAIAHPGGLRIAFQRVVPTSPGIIDFVLGQPDPLRMVKSPTSASTVSLNAAAIAAHGLTLVPDESRLLVYDEPPSYDFEPASRVVGQAGFSVNDPGTDYRRISAKTLAYPSDVATFGNRVAVADRGNNRVTIYDAAALATTETPAAVVVGQPDATSFIPNVDQTKPSNKTLSGPGGVALDATHLYVADTENHRVLVWTPIPTTNGAPATYVLGQSDFSGRRPNHGRKDADLDGFSDVDADGMFAPTGIATDGTHLYVADRMNNRVLVWDDVTSLSNGLAATRVIGQADFVSRIPNRGSGPFSPNPDGLNLPSGVTIANGSLYVADTENNRVVRYDDPAGSPGAVAFLGQPDGYTFGYQNYRSAGDVNAGVALAEPTTAYSILRPRSVAMVGDVLYVSEADSNRVRIYQHTTSNDSYAAIGQLGQVAAAGGVLNAGGISASSLATPLGLSVLGTRLFVADSANHRVLGYDVATTPANAAPAKLVLGQRAFLLNGFDQSLATSAGGAVKPRQMSLSDGDLFVAETSRNRVVVEELPVAPGKTPKRVYGQPDNELALPNAGGGVTASSMLSPRGVFADAKHVIVADSGNHRVLVFDRSAAGNDAALVLGQNTFTTNAPNMGSGAGPSTLAAPEGVYSDGTRLFVADTGNHRVLVWNTFPTRNGQAADVVIGQTDFASNRGNRGQTVATLKTLSVPASVLTVNGHLFIADSGNNRVVVFDAVPTANDGTASSVLGQPNGGARIPTVDINDADRLAGPVALATDGTNLYVADRDTNRVLAYDLVGSTTARTLFNANSGLVAVGPAGLAVERTPLFTSRLYVADTNNDRVIVLGSVSRLH